MWPFKSLHRWQDFFFFNHYFRKIKWTFKCSKTALAKKKRPKSFRVTCSPLHCCVALNWKLLHFFCVCVCVMRTAFINSWVFCLRVNRAALTGPRGRLYGGSGGATSPRPSPGKRLPGAAAGPVGWRSSSSRAGGASYRRSRCRLENKESETEKKKWWCI